MQFNLSIVTKGALFTTAFLATILYLYASNSSQQESVSSQADVPKDYSKSANLQQNNDLENDLSFIEIDEEENLKSNDFFSDNIDRDNIDYDSDYADTSEPYDSYTSYETKANTNQQDTSFNADQYANDAQHKNRSNPSSNALSTKEFTASSTNINISGSGSSNTIIQSQSRTTNTKTVNNNTLVVPVIADGNDPVTITQAPKTDGPIYAPEDPANHALAKQIEENIAICSLADHNC